jgi:hypothetical protein
MESKERVNITENIAIKWNEKGIKYVIAHGIENYPAKIGRDLDVIIYPKHQKFAVQIALNILQLNGWQTVISKSFSL